MRDVVQADGQVIDAQTVRFERLLPGPIERVWAYLTEGDKRRRWFAGGDMDLRVGGTAEFIFHHSELTPHQEAVPDKWKDYTDGMSFVSRITRCEPPRLLGITWGDSPGDSEVVFELTARGGDVLLTLTHRRLPNRGEMIDVAGGWHTHLDILADVLNGRTPGPFWSAAARHGAEYEKRIPQ
jgi:uncharacterized protein YndB with AHSA1/START domain